MKAPFLIRKSIHLAWLAATSLTACMNTPTSGYIHDPDRNGNNASLFCSSSLSGTYNGPPSIAKGEISDFEWHFDPSGSVDVRISLGNTSSPSTYIITDHTNGAVSEFPMTNSLSVSYGDLWDAVNSTPIDPEIRAKVIQVYTKYEGQCGNTFG